jgi:alpha-N-arabinofuranosidase
MRFSYYYGLMFEDISRSGDGGIYGELLMNRNLRGKLAPFPISEVNENIYVRKGMKNSGRLDLDGWKAVGPCQISLDTQNPLSRALPAVIKVVTNGAPGGGECGIQNSGKVFLVWSS